MSPTSTRNAEAINADVVRQLLVAPDELKRAYRSAGYEGVIRWTTRYAFRNGSVTSILILTPRWADLCNTVVRLPNVPGDIFIFATTPIDLFLAASRIFLWAYE